jgi:hypothetical protein
MAASLPPAESRRAFTAAWFALAEPSADDAMAQRRRRYFASFLRREHRDVAALLAACRRLATTDAARFTALDLYFNVAVSQPAELSGPISRALCVATCISLALKFFDMRLNTADIVCRDPYIQRHSIGDRDVRQQEPLVMAANDHTVAMPRWWLLVEALFDTDIVAALVGAMAFRELPAPSAGTRAARKRTSTRTAVRAYTPVRRRHEAAMRYVGMLCDDVLLAAASTHCGSPLGAESLVQDTQRTPLLPGPPDGSGLSPSFADDTACFTAALLCQPEAVYGLVVSAAFGLLPGDLRLLLSPDVDVDKVDAAIQGAERICDAVSAQHELGPSKPR